MNAQIHIDVQTSTHERVPAMLRMTLKVRAGSPEERELLDAFAAASQYSVSQAEIGKDGVLAVSALQPLLCRTQTLKR